MTITEQNRDMRRMLGLPDLDLTSKEAGPLFDHDKRLYQQGVDQLIRLQRNGQLQPQAKAVSCSQGIDSGMLAMATQSGGRGPGQGADPAAPVDESGIDRAEQERREKLYDATQQRRLEMENLQNQLRDASNDIDQAAAVNAEFVGRLTKAIREEAKRVAGNVTFTDEEISQLARSLVTASVTHGRQQAIQTAAWAVGLPAAQIERLLNQAGDEAKALPGATTAGTGQQPPIAASRGVDPDMLRMVQESDGGGVDASMLAMVKQQD
jgi:hypothetical protein